MNDKYSFPCSKANGIMKSGGILADRNSRFKIQDSKFKILNDGYNFFELYLNTIIPSYGVRPELLSILLT
jgi:hypothetical protein